MSPLRGLRRDRPLNCLAGKISDAHVLQRLSFVATRMAITKLLRMKSNFWNLAFARLFALSSARAYLRFFRSADFLVRSNTQMFQDFGKLLYSLCFSRCCGLESPRSDQGRTGLKTCALSTFAAALLLAIPSLAADKVSITSASNA